MTASRCRLASLLATGLLTTGLLAATMVAGCVTPPPPQKLPPMGQLPSAVTSAEPLWVPFRVRAGKPFPSASASPLKGLRQLTFDGRAGSAIFERSGQAIVYESGSGKGRCGKLMRLDLQSGKVTTLALAGSHMTLAANAPRMAFSSATRCNLSGAYPGGAALKTAKLSTLHYPESAGTALNPAQRLTANGPLNSPLALSPDGRTLFFTDSRSGDPELYAATLSAMPKAAPAKPATQTTPQAATPGASSALPSAEAFASSAQPQGDAPPQSPKAVPPPQPTVSVPGRKLQRLTQARGYDGAPQLSPDGRLLVWHAERLAKRAPLKVPADADAPAPPPRYTGKRVMMASPRGQNARVIAAFGNHSAMPTFAADSRHVLFASDRDSHNGAKNNYEIYRINPDGALTASGTPPLERLTFDEHYDGAPAVSPDGEWLLFSSGRGGSDGEINLFIARLSVD